MSHKSIEIPAKKCSYFLISALNQCKKKEVAAINIKSIIVTEDTVRSPFIAYCSQNPWNFLNIELITNPLVQIPCANHRIHITTTTNSKKEMISVDVI